MFILCSVTQVKSGLTKMVGKGLLEFYLKVDRCFLGGLQKIFLLKKKIQAFESKLFFGFFIS
jgi:hypothetical protein